MNEKLIYEEETYALHGAIFEVYKTLGDGYTTRDNAFWYNIAREGMK